MVAVVEVDLVALGVRIPRGEVGMVVAQPYVDFVNQEPFTWQPTCKQRALECIDATLEVALKCSHGADKTHFTVFPECTIPGLDGVDRVSATLSQTNWPTETVVIGGVDGLTKDQFEQLVQRHDVTFDSDANGLDRIQTHQWVNCVLTWVKLPTGQLRCWVQPKLAPAWVELNVDHLSMYKGRSVFVFKGNYSNVDATYQFATLLCFDWIGTKDNARLWDLLLQGIATKASASGGHLPLTWLFVAQCNPEPSHASFMQQVAPFYDPNKHPRVQRDETCLVMANVAGKREPGKAIKFGRSAVIFNQGKFVKPDCPATYCNGGERQRPGSPLEAFRDVVFRERGACIHSFLVTHPGSLVPGSAGKRLAVPEAVVHPFPGVKDPRTPASIVPAIVKWVNDELDDGRASLGLRYPKLPLAAAANAAHDKSVSTLRWLPGDALSRTMLIASPGTQAAPDGWEDKQTSAFKHLLHTFAILDVAKYPGTLHGAGTHATIQKGDVSIEVVAVMGQSHEECDEHVMQAALVHRGPLLLVSRDLDNSSWDPRMRSILDQADDPSEDARFTDPRSSVIRIAYQDFLKAYQEAANEADLRKALDAAIS